MKKWIINAIGLLVAGTFLTGCSKEVEQKNDSLHVYAGVNDVIMDYAVKEFQRRYPDISVEYEGRKIIEDTDEHYGYNQQISAQLMSGSGADIFFLQDYWDIDKLVQAGAFADLNEIYENSAVFHDDDFAGNIMDAGVFDGKRYFLPMEYRLPMLISTREILEEAGFHSDNCTDFDSFMEESNRYLNSANYDRRLFRMDITAINCIFWAGYSIVENGEVVWDIEETRDYFEWNKAVYEGGTDEYMFGDLLGAEAVRDGACLFEGSGFLDTDLNAMRALYTIGNPVALPIYNKEGGITALINRAIVLMLMPYQVTLVSNFIITEELHLNNTYWAILLPGIFSPFGVFLMRQGFDAMPESIREAAMLEGSSQVRLLVQIAAPVCKGPLTALILLCFVDAWNMVEQPLVFLKETFRYPISVFLAQMNESRMDILCACGILVLLPVLLLFLFSEEDLTISVANLKI